MSKETYSVNEPKVKTTWKLLSTSIIFVFALAISMLFLKYCIFYDDDIQKDGNLDQKNLIFEIKAQYNLKKKFISDSICQFVAFGPIKQSNLKHSNYWKKIENDVKDLCSLGHNVQIYSIGNVPVSKRLDEGNKVKQI